MSFDKASTVIYKKVNGKVLDQKYIKPLIELIEVVEHHNYFTLTIGSMPIKKDYRWKSHYQQFAGSILAITIRHYLKHLKRNTRSYFTQNM